MIIQYKIGWQLMRCYALYSNTTRLYSTADCVLYVCCIPLGFMKHRQYDTVWQRQYIYWAYCVNKKKSSEYRWKIWIQYDKWQGSRDHVSWWLLNEWWGSVFCVLPWESGICDRTLWHIIIKIIKIIIILWWWSSLFANGANGCYDREGTKTKKGEKIKGNNNQWLPRRTIRHVAEQWRVAIKLCFLRKVTAVWPNM